MDPIDQHHHHQVHSQIIIKSCLTVSASSADPSVPTHTHTHCPSERTGASSRYVVAHVDFYRFNN